MNDTEPEEILPPKIIIDFLGDNTLDIARHLRHIIDYYPEHFPAALKQLQMGRRKAYALAQIDRSFQNLGVPRDRLRRLGWTKLSLLAPYVTAQTVEELLKRAEQYTAQELKLHLRDKEVDPENKTVVLHFTKQEYAVFEKAMKAYGAVQHPRGWLNKEQALAKALNYLDIDE